MTTSDLTALSTSEAAAAIRSGEISARELVKALAQRIEQREPRIQAWVTLDIEGALQQADALDKDRAAGRIQRPLHGVPVGLKDIFFTAGLRTTGGSKVYEDFVPTYDATSVKRLREAGAIVLGKTATTTFAYRDPAPTRNPWNLEHTPGGSSSGSGAAVADRMVPAALGTQTVGSVLRPAAYCGVIGLKPTYGRIGRGGVFALSWSMDHVGVLARTVTDAALLLSVMAGPDDADPSAANVPAPNYVETLEDTRPPRIGLLRGLFQRITQPEAWRRLEEAARQFASAGAEVIELEQPPEFEAALDVQQIILVSEASTYHWPIFRQRPDDFREGIRAAIEAGQVLPAPAYLQAQRARRHISRAALSLFASCDVVLTSPATGPAPQGLGNTGSADCNGPWSLFGFPSLSLPIGLSEDGLPLGAQFSAAPWQEQRLLQTARWCERVLDVTLVPPQDPVRS